MYQPLKYGDHILIRINDGFGMNVPAIVEAEVTVEKSRTYELEPHTYDLLIAGERHPFEDVELDPQEEVTPEEFVQPWTVYGDDMRWCRVPAKRSIPATSKH